MDKRLDRSVVLALAVLLSVALPAVGEPRYILSADDFKNAVRAYVERAVKTTGEEVELAFRSAPESVRTACAAPVLQVEHGSSARLRGAMTFVVAVDCGGVVVRRCMVTVRIRTYARALIAARTIPARATIVGEDVTSVRLETTNISRPVLTDPAACVAHRTRRIISKGSMLYEDLLEPLPTVAAGDRVTIHVHAGGVRVTAEGVAREDGRCGELIEVKLGGRGERLKARVDDDRNVTVQVE